MNGPLHGVRVVEVAGYVFVPMAGAVMADLGADVIKVEPLGGDPMRPRPTAGGPMVHNGVSLLYELANRGKRSVAIDLTSDDGRAALDRLVEGADVFATNYLARVRTQLRVDVADIQAVKPDIVYARGSGWGSHGPMRDAPAFDLVSAWSASGFADAMTDRAGEPPTMPIGVMDTQAGNALAGAIAIALYQRAMTGKGCVVDTALLNVGMFPMQAAIAAAPAAISTSPIVQSDPYDALINWYRTADGRWISFAMSKSEPVWPEFCRVLDRLDFAGDPRFADAPARSAHARELGAELDRMFGARPMAEWRERLAGFTGCWGPVLRPIELHDHPQVDANGFVNDYVAHDGLEVHVVAPPMHFDNAPTRPAGPTPGAGQHTAAVLREIGYDDARIEELCRAGAVRQALDAPWSTA